MMGFEGERRNFYLYNCGTSESIADNVTFDEAVELMNRYLDKVNFKSYYCRAWSQPVKDGDKRVIFDFGSYIKFFHWANAPAESYEKEPRLTYEQMKKNFIGGSEESETE